VAVLALALAAAWLGGGAGAEALDLGAYLAQYRCPGDGLPTACADPAPQRAGDVVTWRRHDWPAPRGYVAEDAVMLGPGAYATTWAFAPFGRFDRRHGDGGEVYRIENGTVRIALTQDGGMPGIQYFIGRNCGGTGWVAFRADAPTGAWATLVATLAIAPAAGDCRRLNSAFTRYRREQVTMPFLGGDGARFGLSVDAIVAEHFNAVTLERASALERSYFAAGWGRLRWEAWRKGGPGPVDLTARCPADVAPAYSVPPAPGWTMVDCRTWSLVVADPPGRVADFAWPGLALSGDPP
jgi:hypothetical protein